MVSEYPKLLREGEMKYLHTMKHKRLLTPKRDCKYLQDAVESTTTGVKALDKD